MNDLRMIPVKPAAPCADCGTEYGFTVWGNRRARRTTGARFGIDGPLCEACYTKHRNRQRKRLADGRQ